MGRKRRRRLRLTSFAVGAAAAMVISGYLYAPVAAADIGGSFATTTNASDPFVMTCTDEGVQGLCMYTSEDMGITENLPPDNSYPMQNTRGFFSTDGGRTWTDRGYVFFEDQIPWVPANPNDPNQKALHLWAPAAWQDPETGFTYLFVPDVSNASLPTPGDPWGPNVHTSSRVAVAFGFSPFGPFGYLSSVADPSGNIPGYMSDPEPFSDSTGRYLLWANGDGDTCGGLSMGDLGSSLTVVSNVREITINGFPGWGNCTRKAPFSGSFPTRPYMEGASLFKFSDSASDLTGLPGPYTLVFAAKPSATPPECSHYGQPNQPNEVIAYATSDTVDGSAGPDGIAGYAYQGLLMCGSGTEWTNQATIAEVTMANGAKRMVLVYHDGPGGTHHRKLHAECLWYGAGTFAMATRTATGFTDCMNGAGTNAWALRSRVFKPEGIVSAVQDNGGLLLASRAAVGPWEQFEVRNGNVVVSPTSGPQTLTEGNLRSRVNGKIVCAENVGTGNLIANRSSVQAWERFFISIGGWTGTVSLNSRASGLDVTTQTNRALRPTNPARAPDEQFDILHL